MGIFFLLREIGKYMPEETFIAIVETKYLLA